MAHGGNKRRPAELDEPFARVVADTMKALSTPSRLRILGRLHASPCSVSDLAQHVGMEGSAVSHQLRILRHLGLVAGQRAGRNVIYSLHDDHVGQLLSEAIAHVEHLDFARTRTSADRQLARA
jgi:DNA-binding transcriptional ArsR family regulator